MEIVVKQSYINGTIDTDKDEMYVIPARKCKQTVAAELCIRSKEGGPGLSLAEVYVNGKDIEQNNLLAEEIARRWNECPQWHDAQKELPEGDERVLVMSVNEISTGHWNPVTEEWYIDYCNYYCKPQFVKAWMRIRQYKESE